LLVRASKASKFFGAHRVFKDLDFAISRGDRIALVGENGSGKSTLFLLLAGRLQPDSGTVTLSQGATVGYLQQEPQIDEQATPFALARAARPDLVARREDLDRIEELLAKPEIASDEARLARILRRYGDAQEAFDRGGGYDLESRVNSVLHGLGFVAEQIHRPVASLSGGERKLVALAQLLVQKPDLLLLDEPDSHLDLPAKAWLEEYVLSHPGAVALISHDRYFLDHFINCIFELEDGRLYEYRCNYSGLRAAKQQRLEREAQLYNQQQREVNELKASAERLARWAALNNKFAGRARNRKRLLKKRRAELEAKPRPVLQRSRIDLDFGNEARSGKIVAKLHQVSKRYGDRLLFEPFELVVQYGERIGLIGPNGSGKTTLLRMLMRQEEPSTGRVEIGAQVKIGYYSQDQESLDRRLTPVAYLQAIKPMHRDEAVRFLIGKLLLSYQNTLSPIGELSGGQRSRLLLAGLALSGVNLLLLDEPTNNLDIPSMMVLEDALVEFDGTAVMISHDRYFLDQLVDRVLAIDRGRVEAFPGNFTEFYDSKEGRIDIGMAADRRRPVYLNSPGDPG
jgi:ATP-binding cassette, subfamily F, member 3